ncbi:hypothetical protein [Thermococcus kodakarensis]|uniref:hypothetical protein n=1 Tax=Thermococcus kodakarensis TaxID=311400 RepID=UPI00064E5719|nr:hypothetical protein [Thermococcus kodakarensis]WCN29068.1 hypothetical protein POG15_05660 [Thermococcus kodakarensis]WCN31373.1 hypothetical protein POG21_05660 [Thermococcus kodakarensis]
MGEVEKTGYVALNREWRAKMDELRARARANLDDVLQRAFGSIKSEKSWRELEAELYEELSS